MPGFCTGLFTDTWDSSEVCTLVLWWSGGCCEWLIEPWHCAKRRQLALCVYVSENMPGMSSLSFKGACRECVLCWRCGRCSQSSSTACSNVSVLTCISECSPVHIYTILQVWLNDRQIVLPSCCLCEWISSTFQWADLLRDFWNHTIYMRTFHENVQSI